MSTERHDLVVARRGQDPAAETCAHALRDLIHAAVSDVQRAELWRFTMHSARAPGSGDREGRDELRARLRDAACRAGRYVNTNRDLCTWEDEARPYPDDAPALGCAVDLWVRDGEGRDAAALAWFRAQADADLADVQRGVLWRLVLPMTDPEAARQAALDLAVTRSREHGLLANPHVQTTEVLHVVRAPTVV